MAFLLLYGCDLFAQTTDTIKINITHQIYDTTKVVDTVFVYDTVYIDRFITNFEINAHYSPFLTNWRKFEIENYKSKSQNNFSTGIEFGVISNYWSLNSGFSYTRFSNDVQFDIKIIEIDSSTTFELDPQQIIEIDTIGSEWQAFTFDTIVNDTAITITDSTLIFYTDTIVINYNDTIYTTVFDTTSKDTSLLRNEKIRYFEIPIILRYSLYESEKLDLKLGLGLITGIMSFAETYYRFSDSNELVVYQKSNHYKFMYSIYLSLRMNYLYRDNTYVFIEPYYYYGLRSIYKKEVSITRIPDRYGVRFGLAYRF